ncbi:hypothetical protein BDZ89DRAFT_1068082 [Hymenopellis radicata]|nr:hypothetical protein BDZ89DRAFT_1068082 [Hymenopellis radicata]
MADIFPPEVFDTILDQVYILDGEAKSNYYSQDYSLRTDSTKPVTTLLSCSLVCRSWLPRTRLHTFDTVHLTGYFDRTIGVTFGALVAHPLCTFRSHVRRLSLHELHESYNRNPAEGFWINSVLPQLALLPHVEDVSIYHARFTNVAEEEWRAGMPLFGPQLKRLDMQSTYFDRISRMTELVSRCTNLESLALRYIFPGKDGAPQAQGDDIAITTPSSRILQSLSLRHEIAISAEFLTWLCATPGSIKILTVDMGYIGIKEAHHVSRFLYDIGQSITSLAIAFVDSSSDSTDGQDAFCRVADLTTLTKLETLRFGVLVISPTYPGRGLSAKHVPSILEKLSSPCLKEIRFDVSMEKAADHCADAEWCRLFGSGGPVV